MTALFLKYGANPKENAANTLAKKLGVQKILELLDIAKTQGAEAIQVVSEKSLEKPHIKRKGIDAILVGGACMTIYSDLAFIGKKTDLEKIVLNEFEEEMLA